MRPSPVFLAVLPALALAAALAYPRHGAALAAGPAERRPVVVRTRREERRPVGVRTRRHPVAVRRPEVRIRQRRRVALPHLRRRLPSPLSSAE